MKCKRTGRLFALVVALTGMSFSGTAGAGVLFSNARTDWKIRIPTGAGDTLAYAAQELTNAFFRISGARFAIERSDAGVNANVIAFESGSSHVAKEISTVRTLKGGLLFTGNSPRATLYAVYGFLERELGCRWLWSGETGAFYPRRTTFDLPAIDRTWTPHFHYRGLFNPDARMGHEIWQSRNRLNSWAGRPEVTKHTGAVNLNGNHIVGMTREDITAHSNMLALVHGQRIGGAGCWSNEGFVDLMAERIIAWCDKMNLSIVQPYVADVTDRCECENCRKDAGDDPKAFWWKVFQRIRVRIRAHRPNQRFAGLAYQEYRAVPKQMPGADELEFVEYAQYNRCYVHGVGDSSCPLNAKSFADLKDWSKLVPMGIYGYEFDIFTPRMYVPFWNMLADQMKAFRDIGIVDVKSETCNWSVGPTVPRVKKPEEIARLPAWIYTRLLSDPDADVPALVADFCACAYGDGGADMAAYHLAMADAWDAMKVHYSYFGNRPAGAAGKFLSPELIRTARNRLAAAKHAVAHSSQAEPLKQRWQENVALDETWFGQWEELYKLAHDGARNIAVPDATSFDRQTSFELTSDGLHPRTTFQIYAGEKALEIRIDCAETNTAKLVSGSKGHDARGIFGTDYLELFIEPTDGAYRHFAVNAAGGQYDALCQDASVYWNWTNRVEQKQDRWILNLSFPYDIFGGRPAPGSIWKLVIDRLSAPGACGFPQLAFHDMSAAACLYFSGQTEPGRSLVWINDEGAMPTRLESFLGNGWSPVFVKFSQAPNTDLSRTPMIVVRQAWQYRDALPLEFFRNQMLSALTNGAVVVVDTYGAPPLHTWFGDPDWRVGDELYKLDPRRRTCSVTDSEFVKYPSDIRTFLLEKNYPPSGVFRVDKAKWEYLACRKTADGMALPYLACRPFGKGLLVLSMNDGYTPVEILNNLIEYNKRINRTTNTSIP